MKLEKINLEINPKGNYIFIIGDSNHEPSVEQMNAFAATIKQTWPKLKFMLLPYYYKIAGQNGKNS